MKRTAIVVLPFALASLFLVAADQPEGCYSLADPEGTPEVHADDVLACHVDTYIKATDNRIGNLQGLTGTGGYPTFSTEPPQGSYSEGHGGATPTSWAAPVAAETDHKDDRFALTVEGEFEGNIDSIALDLYAVNPVDQYAFGEFWSQLHLEIDGKTVFDTFGSEKVITSYETVDEHTVKLSFVFTDIWESLGGVDSTEETHTVKFQLNGYTYGDESMFVYDADEFPASMRFNLGSLAGYQEIQTFGAF